MYVHTLLKKLTTMTETYINKTSMFFVILIHICILFMYKYTCIISPSKGISYLILFKFNMLTLNIIYCINEESSTTIS